jgi:hypothetical protein
MFHKGEGKWQSALLRWASWAATVHAMEQILVSVPRSLKYRSMRSISARFAENLPSAERPWAFGAATAAEKP